MALNPGQGGDSHNWNYSKPDREGYSLSLTGTVVALQEVQAMNFGNDGMPTTPKFWDNSNQPMMNIRMVLVGKKGGYRTLTFTPAGKDARDGKKPSLHMDLFRLAGGQDILKLIGKTIHIWTEAAPDGFRYGIGKPRPWYVELVNEGPYELAEPLDPIYLVNKVLAETAVSGGAVNPGSAAPAAQCAPAAPASQPEPEPDGEEIPF